MNGDWILESEAVRSSGGKICTPNEAVKCTWGERAYHPDDVTTCDLTGLIFHKGFIDANGYFKPLVELLNGVRLRSDQSEAWPTLMGLVKRIYGNINGSVEAAEKSPDGQHLALCVKVSSLLGLKVQYLGVIYSNKEKAIIGSRPIGKRKNGTWIIDVESPRKKTTA